ncbi:MAG: hypothetical protein AVDCRST_MAG69-1208, partial [uncultured Solirubrobacteraceae bacterium]
ALHDAAPPHPAAGDPRRQKAGRPRDSHDRAAPKDRRARARGARSRRSHERSARRRAAGDAGAGRRVRRGNRGRRAADGRRGA